MMKLSLCLVILSSLMGVNASHWAFNTHCTGCASASHRHTNSRTAQRCCATSLCKCLHARACVFVWVCECVCAPGGVVLRGEMIVALTHQLLFHGCLVKKLVDLISGSGGGCERYKAPCRRVIGGISLSLYTQLNIFHPSLIVKYNSRSLIRQIMQFSKREPAREVGGWQRGRRDAIGLK